MKNNKELKPLDIEYVPKAWLNGRVPKYYWNNEDHVKEALLWLFEEKLDIENNNIISGEDFKKYNLYGLFKLFNNSPYDAINYVYPNKYKPWEKCNVPRNYWNNEDHVKEALLWLFEEKLDIENNNISANDFRKNKLYGLLTNYFNNSPYDAINYMYPDKYKPWEKCSVPRRYWDYEDNIKEALHWLFEEKLDIENNDCIVTVKDFEKYNLLGLLSIYFNNSPYEAINYMYPDKYKPWEKCCIVPKYYWNNEDNIKDALRWLFEEKLDIKNIDDISINDFINYKLTGLLKVFNNSKIKVIEYYKNIK